MEQIKGLFLILGVYGLPLAGVAFVEYTVDRFCAPSDEERTAQVENSLPPTYYGN